MRTAEGSFSPHNAKQTKSATTATEPAVPESDSTATTGAPNQPQTKPWRIFHCLSKQKDANRPIVLKHGRAQGHEDRMEKWQFHCFAIYLRINKDLSVLNNFASLGTRHLIFDGGGEGRWHKYGKKYRARRFGPKKNSL